MAAMSSHPNKPSGGAGFDGPVGLGATSASNASRHSNVFTPAAGGRNAMVTICIRGVCGLPSSGGTFRVSAVLPAAAKRSGLVSTPQLRHELPTKRKPADRSAGCSCSECGGDDRIRTGE